MKGLLQSAAELLVKQMDDSNDYSLMKAIYVKEDGFIKLSQEEKVNVVTNFLKEWGHWSYMDEKYGKISKED